MMFKVTIFIALAAVLVQSYVPISYEDRLLQQDVELEGAIDELKKLVNNAVAEAKAKLLSIGDQLSNAANAVVAQAKKALDGEFKGLLEELQNIKDRAKALGLDIVDCLKSKEDTLKGLPKKYGNKLLQCGIDKVNQGKKIISDAKDSVEGSIAEVKALSKELDDCGDSWTSYVCKGKVGVQIAAATINIPVNVVSISTNVIPLVQTLHIDLEQCAVQVGRDFLAEGKGLIAQVETCVTSKIKPSSPKP